MLKYDEFMDVIVKKIKNYLPLNYSNYKVEVQRVHKINEELDAMCLISNGDGISTSPVVYFDELYNEYKRTDDIIKTLEKAAV